ncbi:MAG: Rieske 2Fe-2S domain-containing protein [Rhodobacteraceae bacterium]|nr:Rieske 2Fe-2S domain-containing protein [Paracoccaceae bacterium]
MSNGSQLREAAPEANGDLPVTALPQESYTLPSRLYTDPAVYELERNRIFFNSWQYVAHQSCLSGEGDYCTVQICDQNLFVIRGGDGELRAFHNVCRHRAHELVPHGQGTVKNLIVCPYHAWTYTREGMLRGAPNAHLRPGFNRRDFCLAQVRLEIFLNCVFVNLNPHASSLAEQAGDLERDVRTRLPFFDEINVPTDDGCRSIDIKAGWKVVVDNYIECYHCDHAHPAFADIICLDSYRNDVFGMWARQLGEDLKLENSAYRIAPDDDIGFSAFWYLWPNTTINVMPGEAGINISAIRPAGCMDTCFDGHTLTRSGKIARERRNYLNNVLVAEDVLICESVQRGLASQAYSQGPIIAGPTTSGRGEHALHHFHGLVARALDIQLS